MKRSTIAIVLATWMLAIRPAQAGAQSHELAQLALNYQKLAELKKVLSNMKQGYTILRRGYATVKDLSEGSFTLHNNFLSAQQNVNPAVSSYWRVREIIRNQALIAAECKQALKRYKRDINFQPAEVSYIDKVYRNILLVSQKNLEELTLILTSSKLRMSDGDRLNRIDDISSDLRIQLGFLLHFNNTTTLVARQRARQINDIKLTRILHGAQN